MIFACAKKEVQSMKEKEIFWGYNIDSAITVAAQSNKILMIDFTANWCPPCRKMEKETFSTELIVNKSDEFINIRIDVDKQGEVANKYKSNANKYGGIGIPNILFIDKDKKVVRHIIGFHNAEKLESVMDSVLTGKY